MGITRLVMRSVCFNGGSDSGEGWQIGVCWADCSAVGDTSSVQSDDDDCRSQGRPVAGICLPPIDHTGSTRDSLGDVLQHILNFCGLEC